jgi:hypothetical protein
VTRRLALLALVAAPASESVTPHDFLADRMNRFTSSLRDFCEKYNRHIFDAKEARLLSKLWRDVEDCGDWPKPSGRNS